MDWPRARAILLTAFAMVNVILAYAIWGPPGAIPGFTDHSEARQLEQLRDRLRDRGLILPVNVEVPKTPPALRFLYVEYQATPAFSGIDSELSGKETAPVDGAWMHPTLDLQTRIIRYQPDASGPAARQLNFDNRQQVTQAVQEFLEAQALLPNGAVFSGAWAQGADQLMVEYVQQYERYPVFSGFVRAAVSPQGIETVTLFWVEPRGYTDTPPKAVRPVAEALLRLAGRLELDNQGRSTVADIQIGYYAGQSLTGMQTDEISGWDTVPVWRITLDTGAFYYINAFNGEWES